MWLYWLSRATVAFAILIFHLSQPLMLWVCSCFFPLQLYFGCPSEPEKGIKVLGKCPDSLQVGEVLLHFLSRRRRLKAWARSRST